MAFASSLQIPLSLELVLIPPLKSLCHQQPHPSTAMPSASPSAGASLVRVWTVVPPITSDRDRCPAAQQGAKIPFLTLLPWANPNTNCIRSGPDKTWKVFKEEGLDRGQVGQSWTVMHSLQRPQLISQEVRRGQLFKTPAPWGSKSGSLYLCTNQSLEVGCPWGREEVWLWGRWLSSAESNPGERLRSWGTKALEWLGEWVPGPWSGGSGVAGGASGVEFGKAHHNIYCNYCFLYLLIGNIYTLY